MGDVADIARGHRFVADAPLRRHGFGMLDGVHRPAAKLPSGCAVAHPRRDPGAAEIHAADPRRTDVHPGQLRSARSRTGHPVGGDPGGDRHRLRLRYGAGACRINHDIDVLQKRALKRKRKRRKYASVRRICGGRLVGQCSAQAWQGQHLDRRLRYGWTAAVREPSHTRSSDGAHPNVAGRSDGKRSPAALWIRLSVRVSRAHSSEANWLWWLGGRLGADCRSHPGLSQQWE